jgi:hypothetical protein
MLMKMELFRTLTSLKPAITVPCESFGLSLPTANLCKPVRGQADAFRRSDTSCPLFEGCSLSLQDRYVICKFRVSGD